MKLLNNAVVYVVFYLLLMVPTYVLPYLGSNSALIGAAAASSGAGSHPLFWLHAMFLFALCVIAWARGGYVKKNWLAVLPGLATFFDLMPGFSMLFLVPTGLHVAAIICGVVSKPMSQGDSPVPSVPLLRDAKFLTLAVGCGILFSLFLSRMYSIENQANKTVADLRKGVPLYRAGKDDGPRQATPPAARPSRPSPTTPPTLSLSEPPKGDSNRPPDARLLALLSTGNVHGYFTGVFQQGSSEFPFNIWFTNIDPTSGRFEAIIEYPSLGAGSKELVGRVTENRLDMNDVRYINRGNLGFLDVRYALTLQAPGRLTGRWHHSHLGSGNFWIDTPVTRPATPAAPESSALPAYQLHAKVQMAYLSDSSPPMPMGSIGVWPV